MLDPYVDKFVLVECVETFSGKQKHLHFSDNKQRFEKYLHKIHHHITFTPPKSFEDLQQRILDDKTNEFEKQVCIQALTTSNLNSNRSNSLKNVNTSNTLAIYLAFFFI